MRLKEIALIKNGEIALKGLNRNVFEDLLIKNVRDRLTPLGDFLYQKSQSTIVVTPQHDDISMDLVIEKLKKIYGIAAICRAAVCPKDMDQIGETAAFFLGQTLENARTFKVEAKRSDKAFPLKSPEICNRIGAYLQEKFPHLVVDVKNPQVQINIEVRDHGVYIHAGNLPGAGGMPVGSSGRGILLLSGGIDSPVAGAMMAQRGLRIIGVHFASPPYTSDRSLEKVETLCAKMAEYTGRIPLFIVPFTTIQLAIMDHCQEDYSTLIMRRFMCRIAERIALKEDCGALITGESLGQVASQTMPAIAATDSVCNRPVFRPVIGMDKVEIMQRAKNIDTYDTSILPYEDCCTVFTPKHPRTKPRILDIMLEEAKLDVEALVEEAFLGAKFKLVGVASSGMGKG